MYRKTKLLSNLLVFVLCVGIATALWFAGSLLLPSYTVDSFVNDMRAGGATVQVPLEPPSDERWFPVGPRQIIVDGETIFVYPFADNLQAFRAALAVRSNGFGIAPLDGTTGVFIDWIVPPRWYRKGQLIIRYATRYSNIESMLEKLLGRPFAGPETRAVD